MGYDIALFSAGGAQSKKFAPAAVKANCVVVDNSSFYRMHADVPLVVPEINPEAARSHNGIIANPNCSTIIMNMAVWPIHKISPVSRIIVSTYQAASGAGAAAMRELEQQARDWSAGKPMVAKIFPRPLLFNLFSHNSKMDMQTGYNEEEVKMIKETWKIFGSDKIGITATCVRVPVLRAHCESINLTLRFVLSFGSRLGMELGGTEFQSSDGDEVEGRESSWGNGSPPAHTPTHPPTHPHTHAYIYICIYLLLSYAYVDFGLYSKVCLYSGMHASL